MTTRSASWMRALGLALVLLTAGNATAQDLPRVKGKKVVATVQGEPITLDELDRQVAAMKGEQAPGAKADASVELAVLHRMISMVLITQEARRMELDKLPEIRKMVDSFSRVTLREELVERVVADVRADPKEVDQVYRASVREWKISAALFAKEEHAKSLAADLKAGKDFGELARAYLAQGRATKVEDGVFLKRAAMDPQIGEAVARMTVGSTSPLVSTKAGPVILQLQGFRDPEDPSARATAEETVLANKRKEAVAAFDQVLKKKYVKVNRVLLGSIDYESDKPGIAALLKDRRVLAEIKGEKPVTVGELTEELKFQFFHGTAMAAERKRLNVKKEQILEGMLHRKVFRKEALRLGLDKTDTYTGTVKEYETSTLFEAFLRKVIAPDIKLGEDELKAHYDTYRDAYTTPEMIRMKSLVFADRRSAETASESLAKGADFQWVADRADGQVDRNAKGVVTFDGRPIMTGELPDGVRKAVAGAKAGSVRLYADPENRFYVLVVQGVVAAQRQPYEQVRGEIAKKVLGVKIQKAVEEYAEKLRALSEVRVYLTPS